MLWKTLLDDNSNDEVIEKAKIFLKNDVPIIKIDNLAQYYYSETDQEFWDLQVDFPNLAPPFHNFWMEHKSPTFLNLNGNIQGIPPILRNTIAGVAFQSEDLYQTKRILPDKTDCRWSIAGTMFLFNKGVTKDGIFPGKPVCQVGLKEDGSLGYYGDKLAILCGISMKKGHGEPDNDTILKTKPLFHPFFLAISFMHCKNVKMITDLPRVPKNRTAKEPKIKVYTLEIKPMRKVLETEGNSQSTGLRNALHICRGHFKNFDDKPLFGKYTGTYWWDSQVRGRKETGIVIKDYEVLKP